MVGPARRARVGAGIVPAAGADPGAAGPDRTRTAFTRERAREVQRLEKLLEDAGIKLSVPAHQPYLTSIAEELNERPRAVLGYLTPREAFERLLTDTVATTA